MTVAARPSTTPAPTPAPGTTPTSAPRRRRTFKVWRGDSSGGAFADYEPTPFNQFMHLAL